MSDDLLKAIDTLVEQKTFGLDALDAIKGLRDKAAKLESELKNTKDCLEGARQDGKSQAITIEALKTEVEGYKNKHGEVLKREELAVEAIHISAKHEAVAAAYKDILHTIFRPNTVRESIQRTLPVAMTSGVAGQSYNTYVQPHVQTDNISREEG